MLTLIITLIVLNGTDIDNTALLAEKLRAPIESNAALQALVDFPVTAIFDITSIEENDNTDVIFKRVDRALYQAKSEGKNRVVIA